jgi:hypothetical protein
VLENQASDANRQITAASHLMAGIGHFSARGTDLLEAELL